MKANFISKNQGVELKVESNLNPNNISMFIEKLGIKLFEFSENIVDDKKHRINKIIKSGNL